MEAAADEDRAPRMKIELSNTLNKNVTACGVIHGGRQRGVETAIF